MAVKPSWESSQGREVVGNGKALHILTSGVMNWHYVHEMSLVDPT